MKWSLYLGRYFGIKVFIHWTFIILVGWIVMTSLSAGQDLATMGWNIAFVLVLFLCITLHEFGHALVAKKFNFSTKDITLLPIGGLARLEAIPENPKQELWVAIAGPLVNLAITGLLLIILYATESIPESGEFTAINPGNFLFGLMVANFILAVFNLIPAFPMDGGRIFRALLSFKYSRNAATKMAAALGQLLAIIFVFSGLFYNPFLILIGIFIYLGAHAESVYVQYKSVLKGHTVSEIIMHQYFDLQVDNTLAEAVDKLLDSNAREFLVLNNGVVAGTLSRNDIIKALNEREDGILVKDIMNREVEILGPDTSLEEIYQRKQQEKRPKLMPVIEGSKILGVLDLENIMEFIMVQEALLKKREKIDLSA